MIAFGDALRRFREERGLSLRELDKLSGVNYAYIQRLESNEKIAPSDEKIDALCNALKLSAQRKELVKSLLVMPPVTDALFEAMLLHPAATVDAFLIASKVSFRGKRPTTPQEWIAQLDEIDVDVLGNRDQ
jgi:HTH-type transcriptional regulator, competence development regulator